MRVGNFKKSEKGTKRRSVTAGGPGALQGPQAGYGAQTWKIFKIWP